MRIDINQQAEPLNLIDYQQAIANIITTQQSDLDFGNGNGRRIKLGIETELAALVKSDPFLIVGPSTRYGLATPTGTPIDERFGRGNAQRTEFWDWQVDVIYVHDISTDSNASDLVEAAKQIVPELMESYQLLEDADGNDLPNQIAAWPVRIRTAMYENGGLYFMSCCFEERVLLQRSFNYLPAPLI